MKRTEKDTEIQTSERASAAGLKRIPRRHLLTPEETELRNCKVKITMFIDADVLEHFKARAAQPNAAPYQTQINNELRAAMDRDKDGAYSLLLNDERFIAAVAERIQKQHQLSKEER